MTRGRTKRGPGSNRRTKTKTRIEPNAPFPRSRRRVAEVTPVIDDAADEDYDPDASAASTYRNILSFTPPGFRQTLNVKFPDRDLAVCDTCKKNNKTRERCRVQRAHVAAPWTTAYMCMTIDDSCRDPETGRWVEKPLTVRKVQWQPYCVKDLDPFDSETPACKKCKRRGATKRFCHDHQHRQLPWNTKYFVISALESTDPSTIEAPPSKQASEGPEAEQVQSDDINQIDEASRTFLAKVSCLSNTTHWLEMVEFDSAAAGRRQKRRRRAGSVGGGAAGMGGMGMVPGGMMPGGGMPIASMPAGMAGSRRRSEPGEKTEPTAVAMFATKDAEREEEMSGLDADKDDDTAAATDANVSSIASKHESEKRKRRRNGKRRRAHDNSSDHVVDVGSLVQESLAGKGTTEESRASFTPSIGSFWTADDGSNGTMGELDNVLSKKAKTKRDDDDGVAAGDASAADDATDEPPTPDALVGASSGNGPPSAAIRRGMAAVGGDGGGNGGVHVGSEEDKGGAGLGSGGSEKQFVISQLVGKPVAKRFPTKGKKAKSGVYKGSIARIDIDDCGKKLFVIEYEDGNSEDVEGKELDDMLALFQEVSSETEQQDESPSSTRTKTRGVEGRLRTGSTSVTPSPSGSVKQSSDKRGQAKAGTFCARHEASPRGDVTRTAGSAKGSPRRTDQERTCPQTRAATSPGSMTRQPILFTTERERREAARCTQQSTAQAEARISTPSARVSGHDEVSDHSEEQSRRGTGQASISSLQETSLDTAGEESTKLLPCKNEDLDVDRHPTSTEGSPQTMATNRRRKRWAVVMILLLIVVSGVLFCRHHKDNQNYSPLHGRATSSGNKQSRLTDFASIHRGASIIATKTSPSLVDQLPFPYRVLAKLNVLFYGYPPEMSLSEAHTSDALGQCWAFGEDPGSFDCTGEEDDEHHTFTSMGRMGSLTIKLSEPVRVMSVTVVHPAKDETSNPNSAIREFRVIGYQDAKADGHPFFLGSFVYDIDATESMQQFNIPEALYDILDGPKMRSLTLAVDSNWGHEYSCLYRFQVHGNAGD